MRKAVFCLSLVVLGIIVVFVVGSGSSGSQSNTPPKPDLTVVKSIPYATWREVEEKQPKTGVIRYDFAKTFDGINIYNSRNKASAHLIDMRGEVLHTWSPRMNKNVAWQYAEMDEQGNVYALVKDVMLLKVSWDSQILWKKRGRFHHEMNVAPDGRVYALSRQERIVTRNGKQYPILDDYIEVFTPDGDRLLKFSLYDVWKDHISSETLDSIIEKFRERDIFAEIQERKGREIIIGHDTAADIMHDNGVVYAQRRVDGICEKGDLLLSARELDRIGILDVKHRRLRWAWGPGVIEKQHNPRLLENGNILVFDNGRKMERSRVIELNPASKSIVWKYGSKESEKFYTAYRGSSQRLPNGNTLITDSDNGRVFEVSYDGEVVWEFLNPVLEKEKEKWVRAAIYRMMRIVDEDRVGFLKKKLM